MKSCGTFMNSLLVFITLRKKTLMREGQENITKNLLEEEMYDSILKGECHRIPAILRIFKRTQTREWAVV